MIFTKPIETQRIYKIYAVSVIDRMLKGNDKSKTSLRDKHSPRSSLQQSLLTDLHNPKVSFSRIPEGMTEFHRKTKTESSPSTILSLTDFWKHQHRYQGEGDSLTFAKIDHKQQAIKRYLSRVVVNLQVNLMTAFKRIKYPDQVPLKVKKVNRHNKWFKKAGKIIALNLKINTQKALWRLHEFTRDKDQLESKYIQKYIDLVIFPQEYVDFQPYFKSLITLNSMVRDNQLKRAIRKFRDLSRQTETIKRYLRLVLKNFGLKVNRAVNQLGLVPPVHRTRHFYRKSEMLRQFLAGCSKRLLRKSLQKFEEESILGQVKKLSAVSRISSNTSRTLDRVFLLWLVHTKQVNERLKRARVTAFFQAVHSQQNSNFKPVLGQFDPRLRSKFQAIMGNLMAIQTLYRQKHLLRTLKLWRLEKNPWFRRAARIMSLNTVINLQTSTWRLRQGVIGETQQAMDS